MWLKISECEVMAAACRKCYKLLHTFLFGTAPLVLQSIALMVLYLFCDMTGSSFADCMTISYMRNVSRFAQRKERQAAVAVAAAATATAEKRNYYRESRIRRLDRDIDTLQGSEQALRLRMHMNIVRNLCEEAYDDMDRRMDAMQSISEVEGLLEAAKKEDAVVCEDSEKKPRATPPARSLKEKLVDHMPNRETLMQVAAHIPSREQVMNKVPSTKAVLESVSEIANTNVSLNLFKREPDTPNTMLMKEIKNFVPKKKQ